MSDCRCTDCEQLREVGAALAIKFGEGNGVRKLRDLFAENDRLHKGLREAAEMLDAAATMFAEGAEFSRAVRNAANKARLADDPITPENA